MADRHHTQTSSSRASRRHRLPARPRASPAETAPADDREARREWMMVGIGLSALMALLAITWRSSRCASSGGASETTTVVKHAPAAAAANAPAAAKAPTLAESKGVAFEKFAQGRPDAAGGAGRRGQEVHGRRPPARHPGRTRTSRRPRRGATRSTARPTAAPRPARRSSSTRATRSQITFVNGGSKEMAVNMAALDRLPLRRGRAEQELHRRRPRQEADDQLRRQAPRRVHVPLRHAAGPACTPARA